MCLGINRTLHRRPGISKGYTLIEVLVAMAIYMAMLMLAGMALNQGLHQYQGLVEKGIDFWNYAKKISLDKSFNSAIDYYVYTRNDQWFPYFKGDPQSVSFVTLAPFAGELPVVVWIKSEKQANGKTEVVYYELPVYTKSNEDIEREESFGDYKKGQSLKVLEEAESVEFRFYAYDLVTKKYQWVDRFYGNKKKLLPASVKISYVANGEKSILNFRINVNSMAKTLYNERYVR
ncbi:MAG: prepilin-type N-terminal cleavage/methylation domain-containing protein [Smithellaceae bacterium]|jgi:general secretion pathway protein J